MGRLRDTFQTLLHGSKAERRVTRELQLMKVAQSDWEITFLDLLDKLNKIMGKYAKREARELEKAVGLEEPASEAPALDHKAELRKRASALALRHRIPTRRMPTPTAVNGDQGENP